MYTSYSILNTLLKVCGTVVQLAAPGSTFGGDTTGGEYGYTKLLDTQTWLKWNFFPKPDSRDTYSLSDIIHYQQLCFRPITLQPGQVIVITKEIEYRDLDDDSEEDAPEYRRGRRGRPLTRPSRLALRSVAKSIVANYSQEWFTLDQCGINEAGLLEWRFIVNRAKRTPKGRVVIIDVQVEGDDVADTGDDVLWSDSTLYFYQIR